MTISTLTDTYGLIAADVTTLAVIQVPDQLRPSAMAELLASSGTPSEATRGVQLTQGETILGDALTSLGGSGGLYARRYFAGRPVDLYTA